MYATTAYIYPNQVHAHSFVTWAHAEQVLVDFSMVGEYCKGCQCS